MAKKTEVTLLGEVVQLLRKQNQLSTRDRLKEAEEAKRQEKIDEDNKVTMGDDGPILDAKEDFARRFKANIAGKVAKSKMDSGVNKQKKKTQGVIAHATFMTRRLIEKSNQMSRMWRLKSMQQRLAEQAYVEKKDAVDKKDAEEDRREGKLNLRQLLAGFLGEKGLNKKRRKEEFEVIKENKRYLLQLVMPLLAAVGLAANGIHLYHKKALKMMVKAEDWAKMTAKLSTFKLNMETNWKTLTTAVDNFRIKTLKWFGYGPDGKPLGARGSVTFLDSTKKNTATGINFAFLQKIVADRLYAMKVKAYNSVGLGPDGKKLGHTFKGGPHGGTQTSRGTSTVLSRITQPFMNKVRGMIVLMFKPLGIISNVLTNYFASKEGGMIKKFFQKFKTGGGFAMGIIKKVLWPLNVVFTAFEAFKSGKDEYEREGSNALTILGEVLGGGIGFFFGAFADLIKDGTVWIVKKLFGYESDENGKIIEGQGLGGDALRMIQDFSIQDALHTLVAAPYHLISNIVKFISAIFEGDGSYKDTALWKWFTEMPTKVANWFKGFIPEKVRKYFGIEIDNMTPAPMDAYKTMAKSILTGNFADGRKTKEGVGGELNKLTGKPWTWADMDRMEEKYGKNWKTDNMAIYDYEQASNRLKQQQRENVRGVSSSNVTYNGVTYTYRTNNSGFSEYLQEVFAEAY